MKQQHETGRLFNFIPVCLSLGTPEGKATQNTNFSISLITDGLLLA